MGLVLKLRGSVVGISDGFSEPFIPSKDLRFSINGNSVVISDVVTNQTYSDDVNTIEDFDKGVIGSLGLLAYLSANLGVNFKAAPGGSGEEMIVNITSAQILAMGTNPIVLLPAPGVGKYYDIEKVILEYTHNAIAYTTTSTQLYITQGNDLAYFPTFLTEVDNDQIAIPRSLIIFDGAIFSSVYKPVQNLEVKLWNYNGDSPTLGDGTIRAILTYKVRTFGV